MAVTKRNIRKQLTTATALLLGEQAVAEDSTLYNEWNVDLGYLRYEEPDKITVDTYMAMISGNLSPKDAIKLGLVFDTLSGATPSGALQKSDYVTVSGVSGGETTADGESTGFVRFDDTRLAFDATWTHEWQRLIRSNTSAYVSVEGDYTAIGGGLGIEKDTEDRAYTFTAAMGMATDRVGRSDETTPQPLTELSNTQFNDTGKKNTYDALLGITRILNQRTIAMLNYTYSHSLGYHTDPYKIISIADDSDRELTQVYESRPDERIRHVIYSKLLHERPNSGDQMRLSYRYHQDSWQLNSHTLETGYGIKLDQRHRVEPFIRLYHQQAAEFYSRTINFNPATQENFSDVVLPQHASSDARLGELLSTTIGAKYQLNTSERNSVDLRFAYIYRDYSDAVISDDGTFFVTLSLGRGFK